MHNELRDLLHEADGESRRVVVVFLDVRGFSSFAGIAESTDTAEFLKTIYLKILDDYFPSAEFFKPTGDGLLVLLGYNRENLEEVVRSAVTKSIDLVEAFPQFCEGDEMINFDVPGKLGIGLARGSATSLGAKGKALDYSGRPLNLASRLMDLARPSGIVFDDRFGVNLLPDDLKKRFREDKAYVKGLAESKPMTVFCLDGYTEIPESNKRPLDGFIRFSEPKKMITFKVLEERGTFSRFRHLLAREPARTDNIEVHIEYPKALEDGSQHPSMTHIETIPALFGTAAGAIYARVPYGSTVAKMKARGVQPDWPVSLVLEYSVRPDENEAEPVTLA